MYNEGAAGEDSAAYDHTYGIMIVDIDIFHVGLHVGCAGHGNDGELLAAPLALARVRVAVASRLITAKYSVLLVASGTATNVPQRTAFKDKRGDRVHLHARAWMFV